MGRYGFDDLPEPGKRTVVSTHGYWYVKDDDRHGKVVELGLRYNPYLDDLEGPEFDAEDDGWSFIRDKLVAYFGTVSE